MYNKHFLNHRKGNSVQKDNTVDKTELINKIKAIQKNKQSNIPVENGRQQPKVDYKKLYKDEKKAYDKLKKDFERLSQQNIMHKADLSDKEKRIKEVQNKHHTLTEEMLFIKNNRSALVEEYEEKLNNIELEKERINKKLNDAILKLEQFKAYEDRYKSSMNTINQLNEKLKKTKENIKRLNGLLNKKYEDLKTMESEIHTKNEEILKYKAYYDEFYKLNNMINPEQQLSDLYERMDESNYPSFESSLNLAKKYRSFKKFHTFSLTERVNVFGHLEKYEDGYQLESTNGETYQIRILLEESSDESGKPARGILNDDGTVDIVSTYDDETSFCTDEEIHRVRTRRKKIGSKENEVEHVHIGDFKVLIISSRDGKKFTDRLRLHGLQVEWMDGFNKLKETKNMMISADIVLACADSSSHDIIYHVANQGNDPKYQVLFNPNEDTIVSRTIYAKHQLFN